MISGCIIYRVSSTPENIVNRMTSSSRKNAAIGLTICKMDGHGKVKSSVALTYTCELEFEQSIRISIPTPVPIVTLNKPLFSLALSRSRISYAHLNQDGEKWIILLPIDQLGII
jgi:hypothetical protein